MNKKHMNFTDYFPTLINHTLDRCTLKTAAAELSVSSYDVSKLLDLHIPYHQLGNNKNYIKIFKNIDLVYQDNNDIANQISINGPLTTLKNLVDHDVNPDHAELYIQMDQQTIITKTVTTRKEMIFHQLFGEVNATGNSTPVLNEHGDCIGVYVFAYINLSLANQEFGTVLNYLNRGLAKYFIKRPYYPIKIDNEIIIFYFKELECILYLLIGLSSKEISRHMNITPRGVESLIMRIKEKTNAISKENLIQYMIAHHFIEQL